MIPILFCSFALTLLTELPLAVLLGLRGREKLRTVLLMNLATNPPTVFFLTLARKFWSPTLSAVLFLVLELLVWLAETGLLRIGAGLNLKHAALYSLLLNAASCLLGVAVSHL